MLAVDELDVFYGLALMTIIYLRPDGVWPWLARVLRLTEPRR